MVPELGDGHNLCRFAAEPSDRPPSTNLYGPLVLPSGANETAGSKKFIHFVNRESTTESRQTRPSSIVQRQTRNGRVQYVKQYLEGDGGRTLEVIRARARRECDLLRRLGRLDALSGRLGVPVVVEADGPTATIVMDAVAGQAVLQLLLEASRWSGRRNVLQPLYQAGRWLRVFQTLPLEPGDETALTSDPDSLDEYCLVRLEKIRDLGERWLTEELCSRILIAVRTLVDSSPREDRTQVWSHADYDPGNLLWDGIRLTPIDFAMARLGPSLLDVTYFLHRLDVLAIQFPWRRWPWTSWKRAFLAGYGRADADRSPMYDALMLRHWICRLQTLVRRKSIGLLANLHDHWLRQRTRARIRLLLNRFKARLEQ